MKNAIVIYPVLENLDKNLIQNKLTEASNLAEAIFLNVIHKQKICFALIIFFEITIST